jgi:hypothetical protein
MNPYLALSANGVPNTDGGPGVPYPFLCRRALAATSTASAVAAIAAARRMFGMNYTLADRAGAIASLEVSGERHAVLGERAAWVCHTNHYVDSALVPLGGRRDGPGEPNSPLRLARWYELMGTSELIARGALEAMHRDHRYAPDAICRHAAREGEGMTLASMICAPAAGRMWVAYGLPCEHAFVEYALD